jgi:hypothetical protein
VEGESEVLGSMSKMFSVSNAKNNRSGDHQRKEKERSIKYYNKLNFKNTRKAQGKLKGGKDNQ